MKKVLITGAGSYIGSYIKQDLESKNHEVSELDVKKSDWINSDFHNLDTIVHVAAIVHKNEKKIDPNLYEQVNCNLTIKIAEKAKNEGVKQFIFLSTMGVYGINHKKECITKSTLISPKTEYAKSKAKAENRLLELADKNFNICILRPPLVCGENSPGNMTKLINVVKKIHVFPNICNERSYIYVSELSDYIVDCIENMKKGIFFPQSKEYMCTSEYLKEYAKENNINVIFTSIFNPLIKSLLGKNKTVDKVFGDLKYEKE